MHEPRHGLFARVRAFRSDTSTTNADPTDAPVLSAPTRDQRLSPKPLGHDERNPSRRIVLAVPDARHHTHVIGSTGSGKSTLLVNLILADANAGRGVVVIDPKGDLVTDVLARLPKRAGDRLVLVDPAEDIAPPSFNVLDAHGRDFELVADQVTEVFHRLYAAWWGPRTEDVLRSACLTLARVEGTTLAHVPLLLSNERYRAALTRHLNDSEGLSDFWAWYGKLSDAAQANVIGPVMNKLRAVLSRRFTADLFGSATSSFSLSEVLDGGILLCRLPKGIIGEDATRLVGSLLLAGLWQAATRRAEATEEARLDASIYVDECQNFLHLPGSLDDLGQLPRDLAESVAANARNKIFFTLSPDDARVLARHVGPYLGPDDLAHLDRYQAACRLVANGRDTTGFTMATEPAPPVRDDHSAELRVAARARGRSRAEREHERRSRRSATNGDASSDVATGGVSVSWAAAAPTPPRRPQRRADGRFGLPDGA
jgi:hypothetical protein